MKAVSSLAVLITITMLCACDGQLTGPSLGVATLTLTTQPSFDPTGGLFAQECVERYGSPGGCTPYPNDLGADVVTIQVMGDGRTHAEFRANGQILRSGFLGLADGVPLVCQVSSDGKCHLCNDLYGNTLLDTCGRASQTWKGGGGGWQGSDGSGSGAVTGACDWHNAITLYARELNKLLAREGMNFSWAPVTSKFTKPAGTVLGKPGGGGKNGKSKSIASASCEAFIASIKSSWHKCPNPQPDGTCSYCWSTGAGKTCKCHRINVAALEAACKLIPAGCDHTEWSAGLIMSYGIATRWLFSPWYHAHAGKTCPSSKGREGGSIITGPDGGGSIITGPDGGGSIITGPDDGGSSTTPPETGSTAPSGGAPSFPKCQGSPLVLDLGGDGIEPTSPAAGVSFDLLGVGALRTSWVRGDDALLAFDRNRNGQIDSGLELFGEATPGGRGDGFQALATLDSNRDGVVDARDAGFAQLRLWLDRNGDGVSQPDELVPLATRGVRSLHVSSTLEPAAVDRWGNDLRQQGSFTHADGSLGLMVDVYFVSR